MKYHGIELFNHIWRAFRIAAITVAIFLLFLKAMKADCLGHPIDIEIGIQIAIEEFRREQRELEHAFDWIYEDDGRGKEPENRGSLTNRDRDRD